MNIQKEFTVKLTKLYTKYLFIFSVIIISLTSDTFASFLVEPHFNSISGSFTRGDKDGKLNGETAGLRLGYSDNFFMIGLNFENGHFSYDNNLTSNGYSHFQGGGIGTFLGFHFLERLRLWTGYLNTTLEAKGNTSQRFFGQQVEFGLGYRFWGPMLINYKYFNNYFTQEEDDITGKTGSIDDVIRVVGSSVSISAIFIF